MKVIEENTKNLFTIDAIINYCKNTQKEDWCVDVVRSKDGKQNCLLGHIFELGDKNGGQELANQLIDWFEGCWANTYMFYGVNDGSDTDYPQDNAKDRIIAYLEDLKSGKQKNINQLYDEG
jgi:hypothetical protein